MALKSVYHQIELDPEGQDLTVFITHEGVFRFRQNNSGYCPHLPKQDVDHSNGLYALNPLEQMLYR